MGGVSFEALAVQHPPRHFVTLSAPVGSVSLDSQSSSTPCESSSLATSRGRKGQRYNLLFPLEGKCRAAAKGCTRLRVEMKRKGCPDRQTAACLGGVSFEALAVQHPRATTWPSPPRWEACHLILSRLRLPANQVPLPPQGGAHGGKLTIRISHKKRAVEK